MHPTYCKEMAHSYDGNEYLQYTRDLFNELINGK
jgi:hypothetical protein